MMKWSSTCLVTVFLMCNLEVDGFCAPQEHDIPLFRCNVDRVPLTEIDRSVTDAVSGSYCASPVSFVAATTVTGSPVAPFGGVSTFRPRIRASRKTTIAGASQRAAPRCGADGSIAGGSVGADASICTSAINR